MTKDTFGRSGSPVHSFLRMVPGLTVAQVDANTWAVTAVAGEREVKFSPGKLAEDDKV
jgi:hypothetical protein